jgi:hypothetical protein
MYRKTLRPHVVSGSDPYRWLRTVIPFGVVYLLAGVALPNPPIPNRAQFMWRLAAWSICALAFTLHIGLEHFRFRNPPRRTALHAAASIALGAFALAVSANIHALTAGSGNQRLLALALVVWPVLVGLPAFIVAFAIAAGLAWLRPNDNRRDG